MGRIPEVIQMNDVNVPTNAHIQRFLCLPAAPQLLPLFARCMDPGKEITESVGVCREVFCRAKQRGLRRGDRQIRIAVIGDGSTPRTGAMLALTSGWQVTSIDPELKLYRQKQHYPRLCVDARRAETVSEQFDIVAAVHAHVPASVLRSLTRPGGFLVNLPCCVPHVSVPDTQQTVDNAIASVHRTLFTEML